MNAPVPALDVLRRALALSDLTNPAHGPHALQRLVDDIVVAAAAAPAAGGVAPVVTVHRGPAVVSADDNYDALLYPKEGAARDARYTRWVSDAALLRSQMSACLPPLLRARAPDGVVDDEWLVCPGLVYRRDCIDRLHVGEPHQLDLWRLVRASRHRPMSAADLDDLIARVVRAALPGRRWRTVDAVHPYTTHGKQIDVDVDGAWIEVGECGVANPAVLARAGVDVERVSGLAMGLGLDRLLMVRKGIGDIRLLRARDPRVAAQMLDLTPYREVSSLPAMKRDLSIVVDASVTAEDLGDRVRAALGADDAGVVEEVALLAETAHDALPPAARARLRMTPAQKNVLVRVTLRPLERTLTDDDGNRLRDRIYDAIHEGIVREYARSARAPERGGRPTST